MAMKRAFLSIIAVLFVCSGALAQSGPGTGSAKIVAACAAQTLMPGLQSNFFMDETGDLCTNATGGGGGGGSSASLNFATPPVVPTIQAAAYASGNAIGGLQTVSFFRTTAQPTGLLNQAAIEWAGGETVAVTEYVFDWNPTSSTCTDKTAFSLAAADAKHLVTSPFTLTGSAPTGATQTFAGTSLNVSAKNLDGTATQNLYVCLVSGGAFTPAVGDLSLTLSGVLD